GGVERVRDQHGRPAAAAADPALGGDGGEEEAFARAVEHQDLARGIDRAWQRKAPSEPAGSGLAERVEAAVHGVAAELAEMGGDDRADERRHRMLRLADREADRRLAGP